MSLPEAEQLRLTRVIADILSLAPDTVDLTKSRQDYPNWDSLKHLELMMAIEREFEIRFTSAQLTQALEPADIANLLADTLSL